MFAKDVADRAKELEPVYGAAGICHLEVDDNDDIFLSNIVEYDIIRAQFMHSFTFKVIWALHECAWRVVGEVCDL